MFLLLKFCFILFACCFFLIKCEEDLYKLLGIQKTATTREIRQAFKKLALVQHPDKNIVNKLFFKFYSKFSLFTFLFEKKNKTKRVTRMQMKNL